MRQKLDQLLYIKGRGGVSVFLGQGNDGKKVGDGLGQGKIQTRLNLIRNILHKHTHTQTMV